MGNKRYAASRVVDEHRWDKIDLENARYYYWMGEYAKSSSLLFPLVKRLVHEPLIGTKEYEDGERKQASSQREQQQEEEAECSEKQSFYETLFGDKEGPIADDVERDKDGYIVGKKGRKLLSWPSEGDA